MTQDFAIESVPDSSSQSCAGTLYVIATPIGHRSDFSSRGLQLLCAVDLIAAEDTRMTQRLLDGSVVSGRFISLNEHNESDRVARLIGALNTGQTVALVSDAGTPLISDPGFRLVDAAQAAGIRVSPVPGPCAAIAALSASGLATDRFWFEGFLPARTAARKKRLAELNGVPATLIFYVPARDLPEVCDDLQLVFGSDRTACLNRELTKLHETVHRATISDLGQFIRDDSNQQRGEAVLVVEGNLAAEKSVSVDALGKELAQALPPSQAAAMLARLSGIKRKAAWARIERLRNNSYHDEPAASSAFSEPDS